MTKMTPSMMAAIGETDRRRKKQNEYNEANGIVPKTIIKSVRDVVNLSEAEEEADRTLRQKHKMTRSELEKAIEKLEKEMKEASKRLEFEYAAILRDQIMKGRGLSWRKS